MHEGQEVRRSSRSVAHDHWSRMRPRQEFEDLPESLTAAFDQEADDRSPIHSAACREKNPKFGTPKHFDSQQTIPPPLWKFLNALNDIHLMTEHFHRKHIVR